nr:hyalin-like [Lytechinus pictus]
MRKPMNEMISVQWSPPTPVFHGDCGSGSNSSHDPTNIAFRVGTTTSIRNVAWQFSSVSECTFNIEVRAVDTTPPKIICPENISMYGDPKSKTFKVSWRKPSFYDASDTVLDIVTPDIPSNQTWYNFPVFVNTTVKYRITDAYNNVESCRFFVYVKGDTDPPHILYCPRNIIVNGQPKMKSAEIHWDRPQFDDTSDTVMTIVTPNIPNDQTFFTFPVGVNTTVKYNITDAYNNTAQCSFSVYIKETPAASPLVITVSCLAGVLIVVVLALVCAKRYKDMKQNERGSKEKLQTSEVIFKRVDPRKPDGIALHSLIGYSESQLSLDKCRKNLCPSRQVVLERSISEPDIQPQSSGFFEGESIPSFGRTPISPRLESVTEEERKVLVWRPNEEDRSANESRYSSPYYDDSPVSLESTC